MGRTLWRWALLCALGLAGSVGLAAEPPGSDTAANPISRDAVRERSEWLAERRRLLDRAQFDLQALHERLDYEPSAIIEFVTRQIAYEDYPGVLRGALRTLTSRSGNDLDQALLLATLLKDAGLDARIVAGTLPASQLDSKRLLLIERPARPGPFLQGPALAPSDRKGAELIQALLRDGFRRFQSAQRADAAKGPDPEQTITAMTARLGRVLKAAGPLAPPWQPGTGMRDYHWVEYREGGSGPWQAVHPIYSDGAGPGTTPETVTYFGDSIPEALQQRIRVQAFIERSWGERLETVAVMPAWERPAASLASATLVYSNIPNGFLDPGTEDGEAALNASTLFMPTFSGAAGQDVQAFDLSGTTVPLAEAGSSMAGVIQTVGGRLGLAADALDGALEAPSEEDAPRRFIRRHWLEITLIRPGLPDKRIVRELARWTGDAAAMRASLARTVLLRIENGHAGGAPSLDRGLAAIEGSLRGLQELDAARAPARAPASRSSATATDGFAFDAELFLLTSDTWSNRLPGIRGYRPEPTIVARYVPYGRVDSARDGFDIVNAARAVIALDSGEVAADPMLRIGVTDTWIEHLLFSQLAAESDSAYGRLAARTERDWRLVRSADELDLPGLGAPASEVMTDQLQAGNLLVVPAVRAGEQCDAWWQWDPRSGSALGMTSEGWGGVSLIAAAVSSEYVTDLTILYGKTRVTAKVGGCSALYGFLKASARVSMALAFNDALEFSNLGFCSQIPDPEYNMLCQFVVAAMSAGALTPGALLDNPAAFMRLCVTTAF